MSCKCVFKEVLLLEIHYHNVKRKCQRFNRSEEPVQQLRSVLHQMKFLLSVWRDMRVIIHHKLLENNQSKAVRIHGYG